MYIYRYIYIYIYIYIYFELCHACFERGEIPAVWREGIIVPIPKKAEKAIPDPNGYRGISLLSAVYKVFCTVLRMRLESYLEGNQLLCEEQNGFRKRRSCIDNIMMLTMIGRKIIKRKGSMFGGFIDLKKAYDSVDIGVLYGIGLKVWVLEVRFLIQSKRFTQI